MSDQYERMDGFNSVDRIDALKRVKAKLEEDLELFKQEEIDAFVLVNSIDQTLKVYNSKELQEKRRQKYEWAKSLKWNVMHQEKEINMCQQAIEREEAQIFDASQQNTEESVVEE